MFMQLGIRLHDLKKAPLEQRLETAAKQGFTCGHLALSKVISEYSVADSALTCLLYTSDAADE